MYLGNASVIYETCHADCLSQFFFGKFWFLSAFEIVLKDDNFLVKMHIICSEGVRDIFTFLYPFWKEFFILEW